MGVKRAFSILCKILLASCAIFFLATAQSNTSENDSLVTGEFSEISMEFSDSNLNRNEFFKEQKVNPKISAKSINIFVEKGLDLSSLKITLLVIPSLNLTKIIFPFHSFT